MKESELVKSILEYLVWKKIFAWRNNTGAVVAENKGKKRFFRFGLVGSADILAILPPNGRLLAIECKREGNVPTEAQRRFLEQIKASGGLATVVYSLADVEEALKDLKFS